jgi:hypothetical protein
MPHNNMIGGKPIDPARNVMVRKAHPTHPAGRPVIVDFQGNVPERGSNHIELKVDDGPYTPVTSPHTITGLSEGAKHTIYVRAVDQGGGPDLTPAKWTFTIAVITEPAGPIDAIPVDPIIPPENDTGGGGGITNVKPANCKLPSSYSLCLASNLKHQ